MAIGGLSTRIVEDWIDLGAQWDVIIGSLIVFAILILHQNGIADVVVVHGRRTLEKLQAARSRTSADE